MLSDSVVTTVGLRGLWSFLLESRILYESESSTLHNADFMIAMHGVTLRWNAMSW